MLIIDGSELCYEDLKPQADFKPMTEGLPLWRLASSPELVQLGQTFDEMASGFLQAPRCAKDYELGDPSNNEFMVETIIKKHFLSKANQFNNQTRHAAYLQLADNVGNLLLADMTSIVGIDHRRNKDNGDHFFDFELDLDGGEYLQRESQAAVNVAHAFAGIDPDNINYKVPFPKIRAAYVSGRAPDDIAQKVEKELAELTTDGGFQIDLSRAPQLLAATAYDHATTHPDPWGTN